MALIDNGHNIRGAATSTESRSSRGTARGREEAGVLEQERAEEYFQDNASNTQSSGGYLYWSSIFLYPYGPESSQGLIASLYKGIIEMSPSMLFISFMAITALARMLIA